MWKRVVNSKNQLFYISLNEMALLHLLQSEEEEEVLTNSPQWVGIFLKYHYFKIHPFAYCGKYKTLSDSDAMLIPKENCPNDPKTIAWLLIEDCLTTTWWISRYLTNATRLPWYPQKAVGFLTVVVKGQLISKCPFGVFKSSKKTNDFFSRISALVFKKRSNQKNKGTLLYHKLQDFILTLLHSTF